MTRPSSKTEARKGHLLRRIGSIAWRSIAFLVLWGVCLTPFVLALANRLESVEQAQDLGLRLYLEGAAALTIVAASWAMARIVDGRSLVSLGFAPSRLRKDAFVGTAIGIVWLLLSLSIFWAAGWLVAAHSVPVPGKSLVGASIAMLLNTVTQEVLARGYILQVIQSRTSSGAAVIISAFLFTVYHVGVLRGAWLAAVNVFIAGLLFGIAYVGTGNLWLPIASHFTWNVLLGPLLGLTVSGNSELGTGGTLFSVQGPALFTGGPFGIEGGVIVTATTVGAIGLVSWVVRPQRSSG